MADSKVVTRAQTPAQSPVNPEQVLKASKALVAHIKKTAGESKTSGSGKRNILEDDEDTSTVAETPIWLTLNTKRHILDSHRLQPAKVVLPHPLNDDPQTSICLITADPQRAYKDIIASDEFPQDLAKRITRVIDHTHLQKKYRQYEAQRKLFAEHDIFLGDDRIINRLPKALGKTFYKSTVKRPIPVVLMKKRPMVNGKRAKKEKGTDELNARPTPEIVAEIQQAIGAALVNLSPSTNTAVKVALAGWEPEKVAANIETLLGTIVDKFVPQKWANVQGVFIKGPTTVALPVWQATELWVDQGADVVEDGSEQAKAIEAKQEKEKANVGKKRKVANGAAAVEDKPLVKKARTSVEKKDTKETKETKKSKKEPVAESDDKKLNQSISDRKKALTKQKKAARQAMEE